MKRSVWSSTCSKGEQQRAAEATGLKHSPFNQETTSDKMTFQLWSSLLPSAHPNPALLCGPPLRARTWKGILRTSVDQQEEYSFKRHIWINMDESAPNK